MVVSPERAGQIVDHDCGGRGFRLCGHVRPPYGCRTEYSVWSGAGISADRPIDMVRPFAHGRGRTGPAPHRLLADRMGHGTDHHIRQGGHRRRIPRRHAVLLPACRLHLAVRPDTGPSRPAHSSRPLVRYSHSF